VALNEDQVISLIYDHIAAGFPKQCGRCETNYETIHDYVLRTVPLPQAVS